VPDDDPQYFIRPLLCLASNECSTLNQIEYACAALSNIAAIEENQRLLCKAGAIGILSAVEAEEDMGMAACTKFETDLAFIFCFAYNCFTLYSDHAHNALQNISSNLSRNICRSLISRSNPSEVANTVHSSQKNT
jgi:hypothetical protein